MSPPAPELIGGAVRYFDLTGVVGNAILGGILARKAQLDFVGFAVLAVLSGLGGGMLRDTLLQHGTPVALTDYAYLLCALGGAVVAFFVTVEGRVWNVVFPSWMLLLWAAGRPQGRRRRWTPVWDGFRRYCWAPSRPWVAVLSET